MAFLISLVIAAGVVATAIFSVQNATAVSVQLLVFRTVQMPVGIVLAIAATGGLLAVPLGQLVWRLTAGDAADDYSDNYTEDEFADAEDW